MISGLFVLALFVLIFGWPLWVWLTPSKSDGPRIKRDLESETQRVTDISRYGFEWGGRYGPNLRKYEVTVEDSLTGERTTLKIGVEATWFSDPQLKRYRYDWQ